MSSPQGFRLARELERRFASGVDHEWPAEEFNALAMEAFARQFESITAYRAFCEGRGLTPESVTTWEEVPAVPTTAFKHVGLCVGQPEIVFRTSGTTRGAKLRGEHLVASTSLYRASLLPPFAAHLLAGSGRIPFLSLIPSPDESPDSSLSFMVGAAADAFSERTRWLVGGGGELREDGLRSAFVEAARSGEPVLVLATALALLHLVERLEAGPVGPLPEGSRIMETGGFKGLNREVRRGGLHDRVTAATGVPSASIVSEYGMTELLSQLYEPVLSEGPSAAGRHVAPPWLKVRALDPTTLDEVAPGEEGILCFFDLANANSVCHVLTEDVGAIVDGRVQLHGRVRGAEPRGCSRAMDELMTAAESRE